MRERIFKNELIIDLDNNGDNYESFEKCVLYVKENIEIIEINYYSGFFDNAYFHFKHNNEEFKITFSGFMGTEFKIEESTTEITKEKFRQIAKKLISNINN